MSIVLAALDAGPTAQSVLDDCTQNRRVDEYRLSRRSTSPQPTTINPSSSVTDRAHVPLHLLSGPLEPALLTAVDAPDVVVAVIGTKSAADDRRLVGTTARHIIERSTEAGRDRAPRTRSLPVSSAGSSFPSRAPKPPPDPCSRCCYLCWRPTWSSSSSTSSPSPPCLQCSTIPGAISRSWVRSSSPATSPIKRPASSSGTGRWEIRSPRRATSTEPI